MSHIRQTAGLTFDDVLLVPRHSTVHPRDVSTQSRLTRTIPLTGIPLPLLSYGGSSMLAMGLTLGLALALTRRRPGAYTPTEGLAKAGEFS